MKTTKHMRCRMSQRGIRSSVINAVCQFGKHYGDKIIVTGDDARGLSKCCEDYKRVFDQVAEKGGYVVIEKDNVLITAYRYQTRR